MLLRFPKGIFDGAHHAGHPENPAGRQSPLLCSWPRGRRVCAPWPVCSCPRHLGQEPPRQRRGRRTAGRRTGPKSARYAWVPSIGVCSGKGRPQEGGPLERSRHGMGPLPNLLPVSRPSRSKASGFRTRACGRDRPGTDKKGRRGSGLWACFGGGATRRRITCCARSSGPLPRDRDDRRGRTG